MYARAMQFNHERLITFIKERVGITPKNVADVIDVLGSDLNYDSSLSASLFSERLLRSLNVSVPPQISKGGELALLVFAKKGGKIEFPETEIGKKAYIMSPKSFRGLEDAEKTILVLSTGEISIQVHWLRP